MNNTGAHIVGPDWNEVARGLRSIGDELERIHSVPNAGITQVNLEAAVLKAVQNVLGDKWLNDLNNRLGVQINNKLKTLDGLQAFIKRVDADTEWQRNAARIRLINVGLSETDTLLKIDLHPTATSAIRSQWELLAHDFPKTHSGIMSLNVHVLDNILLCYGLHWEREENETESVHRRRALLARFLGRNVN